MMHKRAPHSRGMTCPMCAGGACKYAEGGKVERKGETTPWKGDHSSSTGVNAPLPTMETAGDHGNSQSEAGHALRAGNMHVAKKRHMETLKEQRSMAGNDRTNLAEGGDVEDTDDDTELSHGLGKEFLSAIDSKDHKQIMSAVEACVMHCMNKGDKDV